MSTINRIQLSTCSESERECSDYRTSHANHQKAVSYAKQFQDKYSMKHLYWQLEREILQNILSEYNTHYMHLLDFACGTGRIIGSLEGWFDKVTGIDISHNMLQMARKASKKSVLVCGDVTQENFNLNGSYHVITAFRFFLNADAGLRRQVLQWIHDHLRAGGILICNFHLNPKSLMGIYYRFYSWTHRSPKPNFLSFTDAHALLAGSHFRIIGIYPYGYLFYRRSGLRFPQKTLLALERRLMRLSWLAPHARNFIAVAIKE